MKLHIIYVVASTKHTLVSIKADQFICAMPGLGIVPKVCGGTMRLPNWVIFQSQVNYKAVFL